MIDVQNLRKSYRSVTVLSNVNFHVNLGEIVAIIGPKGAGKSTLLQCLNYLERPDEGQIIIAGIPVTGTKKNLAQIRRKIGMVLQSRNLFANLSVMDNLMLAPIHLLNMSRKDGTERCREVLAAVGMAGKADAMPAALTPGQQQRVAIARTLVLKPDILLFDEPTASLDSSMKEEVLGVIHRLIKARQTMMYATNDLQFARDNSTKVFYMDEGTIYEEGAPKNMFDHPFKSKTQRFVKRLHAMEWVVPHENFDPFDLMQRVHNFGVRYKLAPDLLRKYQKILEDLLLKKIFGPSRTDSAVVSLEFSEVTHHLTMTLAWKGDARNIFDVTPDSQELSELLESVVRERHYSCEDDRNLLTLKV